VGWVDTKSVRRKGQRGRERQFVRRRGDSLRTTVRATFGARKRIRGVLENAGGQPIPGAQIEVLSRSPTSPEQVVGVVSTDAQGQFSYTATGDSSRLLRFLYQGTPVTLPTEQEVTLLVRAASTIHVNRRRLLNGQAVRFEGRLRSLPAPPAGKLVELQVVLSGRWQTFRTTKTDANGTWGVRYRFRRSCGILRYRFRARLPGEAGYTFETGRTRAVTVRVRGRPCR
jgi:hypothetical protein